MWTLKVNCKTSSEHFNGAGQVIITCAERNDNCNTRSKQWSILVGTMNLMDIPFILFLVCLIPAKVIRTSIVGVTYMDDFDFARRYRNLHECDPFYWHPLHLPDECVKMFGNLIRSKIPAPYTIVKEREPYWPKYRSKFGYNVPYYQDYSNSVESYETYKDIPEYVVPIEAELKLYQPRPKNPFDKLFELMRRDVEENPSAPKIASVPYLGGVAMYKQPVSFKTKAMIKTISQAYAKAAYQK